VEDHKFLVVQADTERFGNFQHPRGALDPRIEAHINDVVVVSFSHHNSTRSRAYCTNAASPTSPVSASILAIKRVTKMASLPSTPLKPSSFAMVMRLPSAPSMRSSS